MKTSKKFVDSCEKISLGQREYNIMTIKGYSVSNVKIIFSYPFSTTYFCIIPSRVEVSIAEMKGNSVAGSRHKVVNENSYINTENNVCYKRMILCWKSSRFLNWRFIRVFYLLNFRCFLSNMEYHFIQQLFAAEQQMLDLIQKSVLSKYGTYVVLKKGEKFIALGSHFFI